MDSDAPDDHRAEACLLQRADETPALEERLDALDRVIVEELARYREAVAWLPALANAEKSSGAVKLVGGVLDGPPGEAIAQHLAASLIESRRVSPRRLTTSEAPWRLLLGRSVHRADTGG